MSFDVPDSLSGIIFRDRLRSLIARDGRSITEVAAAAGMKQQQLSQILMGYRRNPSIQTVGRLLVALHARWADLD